MMSPRLPRRRVVVIGSAAMTLFGLLLAVGCDGASAEDGGGGDAARRAPVEVSVAPLEAVTVADNVEVVGTLEAEARTTIASEVAGLAASIAADLGDRVAPGQVLVQIDPTDYELAVAQRRASLAESLAGLGLDALPDDSFDVASVASVRRSLLQAENARAKRDRATGLFRAQPPLISEQEYADLETAAEVADRDYDVSLLEARAQLAAARTRARDLAVAQRALDNTAIRAPGDPTTTTAPAVPSYAVARRMVNVGQLVSEGDALFELVIDDPLRFRGAVPERYSSSVRVGQAVSLSIAGVVEPVAGRVTRIDPTVDVASRTFLIEATVENDERQLRPGGFARAAVRVGDRPAYRAPLSALTSFAGTDKLFAVVDGKAVEQRVRVLNRGGESVVVTGDFEGTHLVATSGTARLSDGAAVTVVEPSASTTGPAR